MMQLQWAGGALSLKGHTYSMLHRVFVPSQQISATDLYRNFTARDVCDETTLLHLPYCPLIFFIIFEEMQVELGYPRHHLQQQRSLQQGNARLPWWRQR